MALQSKRRVLLLTGGVGGAKLALGLSRVLPPDELIIAVNTGDDFDHLGLRICPDIDTTLYTLAGINNKELGWGRADESWQCLETLTALGGDNWFQLGDRDIALHLLRKQALDKGTSLSEFTTAIAKQLGIQASVLPASDQPVATIVQTDAGKLAFQEYFVKRQCKPVVSAIHYDGAEEAEPNPAIAELLNAEDLRAIIIAPSNPFLSIAPVLAINGMRDLLVRAQAPVIAVSPIIGGKAVKGPTAKIMHELALESSASSVQQYYGELLDGFILDNCDQHLQAACKVTSICTKTLMQTLEDREQLALSTLAFCDKIAALQ